MQPFRQNDTEVLASQFGLAPSGSLNVRAWPAHTFLFGGGGLAPDFSASRSSRRQGRRLAGRRRADAARADAAIRPPPPVSAWTCLKTIRRRCHIFRRAIHSEPTVFEMQAPAFVIYPVSGQGVASGLFNTLPRFGSVSLWASAVNTRSTVQGLQIQTT